jgi:hypothetical protein
MKQLNARRRLVVRQVLVQLERHVAVRDVDGVVRADHIENGACATAGAESVRSAVERGRETTVHAPYIEDMGAPSAMCEHTSRMVPGTQGTCVRSATPASPRDTSSYVTCEYDHMCQRLVQNANAVAATLRSDSVENFE